MRSGERYPSMQVFFICIGTGTPDKLAKKLYISSSTQKDNNIYILNDKSDGADICTW